MIQNNLNRAEKAKDDIDKLRSIAFKEREETIKEIEEKERNLLEVGNQLQKKSENLLSNAAELFTRNVEDNKQYRDLWFLIANQFLPKNEQPEISNLKDIIDLWDNDRTKFAALNLAARGDLKCLLFLEDRYSYYNSRSEIHMKSNAKYIQDAITEIRKRLMVV